MELWIRIKNYDNTLIKVDNLYIGEKYGEYYICTRKDNHEVQLSKYKTKERAIEVLNKIQNQILNLGTLAHKVFEMPED